MDQDPRIRLLINPKNLGIVRTLNLGLVQCKGKYIARMDADDISVKNRIRLQYEFLENHPEVGALGCALSYIDGEGKELNVKRFSNLNNSLLLGNPLFHPTVMFRNSIIQSNQIFYREEFQWAEDYFFWLEINKYSKLAALDEVCLFYRITPETSRRKHLRGMLKSTISVKWNGVCRFKLIPTINDVFHFFGEIFLLIIPESVTWSIYIKQTRIKSIEKKGEGR